MSETHVDDTQMSTDAAEDTHYIGPVTRSIAARKQQIEVRNLSPQEEAAQMAPDEANGVHNEDEHEENNTPTNNEPTLAQVQQQLAALQMQDERQQVSFRRLTNERQVFQDELAALRLATQLV